MTIFGLRIDRRLTIRGADWYDEWALPVLLGMAIVLGLFLWWAQA